MFFLFSVFIPNLVRILVWMRFSFLLKAMNDAFVKFTQSTLNGQTFSMDLHFQLQGKSLYLELDEENVTLLDPQDLSILNVQPIQSIRIWGVGRNNGR